MKQVCRYYRTSECLNPNCRFAHPAEYPVYIYTVPGIEIHPDELRIAVMSSEEMVREADNAWLNNYAMFCQENVERDVDILEYPDYFCMPFDVGRVGLEIENLRKSMGNHLGGSFVGGGYKQYDNRRQSRPSGRGRSYDDGGRRYTDSDRPGGSRVNNGQSGSWYPKKGTFGGYQQRAPEYRRDGNFGGRLGGFGQSRKPGWQSQASQPRYGGQNANDWPRYGGEQRNSGYQGFSSSDHPSGFDRTPDPSKKNLDSNDGSTDYEYHNIPYNYR